MPPRTVRHHVSLQLLLPTIAIASTSAACDAVRGGAAVADQGPDGGVVRDGSTLPDMLKPPVPYDLDLCVGSEYHPLEGVTASDANANGELAEYLELRLELEQYPDQAPTVLAKSGTPCASATDGQTCRATLAAFRSQKGWWTAEQGPLVTHRYLVWTRGDEVGAVTSLEQLRDFIGEVDTVQDAALLLTANATRRIPCDGANNARATEDGWSLRVQSGWGCGPTDDVVEQDIAVDRKGETTVTATRTLEKADPKCQVGRRPEGLVGGEPCNAGDAVGRFFADVAHLEAASVFAFDRLAEELTRLGAPSDLVESALASRDDEVRHARMTAKAALRRGASAETPTVTPMPRRSALAIALENAVEGCIRETYGALVAHHQARAAADPSIAAMMRTIADDETRHAGLAWDVAAWLEPKLCADERRTVALARERALADLRRALADEPDEALTTAAGLPIAARAIEMLDVLAARFVGPASAAIHGPLLS